MTRQGSSALRRGRVSLPNHAYHLRFVTLDRGPVFSDFWLARRVVACMHDRAVVGEAQTFAWVLMPDHLHWLVQLDEATSLPKLVQRFKAVSALHVNRQRAHAGPLWQAGYYDHMIRDEENLRDAARYIVANPLRAGLVQRVGDYPLWDAVWL